MIDEVAATSGQRVVYFGHFEDHLVPDDVPADSNFLRGWQAWGQIVAKVVDGIDPYALTYLQREIEVLRGLDAHYFPRLRFSEVFVHDPVSDEPLRARLFVTIEERVDAVPLGQVASSFNSEKRVIELLLRLCTALDLLWSDHRRLVHRDLKPANILIRPNGEVVVIDLGILRATGEAGQTVTGQPGPMTPAYAAPEQVLGEKDSISYKTDFFALGVIAYQLLSSVHPFGAADGVPAPTILHNVLNTNPPTLESLDRATPEVSALVHRLLEKEPYRRHRTPGDLREELMKLGERR